MNTPHHSVIDLQLAAMRMSTTAVAEAADFWARLSGSAEHLAGGNPAERRVRARIARGAALTDHYGRREHDIDPERDL